MICPALKHISSKNLVNIRKTYSHKIRALPYDGTPVNINEPVHIERNHYVPVSRSDFNYYNMKDAPKVNIDFDDFVQQVKNGDVRYVIIEDGEKTLLVNTIDEFIENVALPRRFDVVDLLIDANIPFKIQNNQNNFISDFSQIMVFSLDALIIFLIITMIINRGPNSGSFSFLKSNSKVNENIDTNVRFEDVAGIDEAKYELQEVVDFLKNPESYNKLGAKIPKGILLYGSPGTGKTLLAKAVATEANVPFISCAGSEFIEAFVGVGASRLRDVFKKAEEKKPCIIYIDEIDSIGKKRGIGMSGGNDEQNQTINQLLTLMDGFQENNGIVVIASTNRNDMLDDALIRPGRFDRHIYVRMPTFIGRRDILNVHAKNKPLAEDVKIDDIAKMAVGFSGADLANLINEASLHAAREKSSVVNKSHFEQAFEKIILGREIKSLNLTENKRRVLAYHEAGHALVGMLLEGYDEVRKISIIPRENAGGVTYFAPSEERLDMELYTREYFEQQIMVALGGRVAEEIIFGKNKVTSGASGDIQEVYNIAHSMMTSLGFSETIGAINWEDAHTQDVIEEEIQLTVQNLYNETKVLLEKHIKHLHNLANALLEKNTLSKSEIDLVVGLN